MEDVDWMDKLHEDRGQWTKKFGKKKIGNKPQMTDIYGDHMYNSSQGAVAPQGDGDDQTSRFIYKLY